MGFLILLVIALLIWAFARNPLESPKVKTKIYEINKQWGDFIAGYHRLARTDEERAVTERMLRDLRAQGMPVPGEPVQQKTQETLPGDVPEPREQIATASWVVPSDPSIAQPLSQPAPAPKEPLDNTSILLYFGAFLLVAAAGLFVGFGGATGGVRTFITAVVAALFYCVGFWLWYDRPNLKQAALTFIGIGIVLAPLAGVAAYNYVFRDSGALVWLVTSAACLALYAHAVSVLRHPLLDYVLIGAFVSLFESSVAVLNLPVYYYGWGLAAVGLIVQAVQIWYKRPLVSEESSSWSANLLLPLSLFVSLNMVAEHGSFQLAISLLLSAVYYGLMGWQAVGRVRVQALVAAESLLLASAVFFAYSVQHDFAHAAIALIALAVPQAVWLWMKPQGDTSSHRGTVLLSSLGLAVLFAQGSKFVTLSALITLAVVSVVVWIRQQRVGSYILAVVATLGALIVGVYRVWAPADPGLIAGMLALLFIIVQILALYAVRSRTLDTPNWRMWFQGMVVASALLGLIEVLSGNGATVSVPVQVIAYVSLVGLSWILLIVRDDSKLWTTLAGILPFVPLLLLMTQSGSYDRPGLYVAVTLGAIVWNAGLSLWRKTEQTRAFAAVAILAAPISLASLMPSARNAVFYTGAYSLIVAVLLAARYSARRGDAPDRAGLSYAAAAAVAAVLALSIVPFAHDRLLSATTALAIGVAALVASRFIEKLPQLMAVLPFVVQIGLWSTYIDGQLVVYSAMSALAAALGYYFYATSLNQIPHSEGYYVHYASLVASYIPVMIYMGITSTDAMVWVLPWAVLLAAVTTFHAVWGLRQNLREAAGGFVALAVLLLLHYYGLRNVQVYAHVIAALFAVYAYWRWRRGEHAKSDSYITATLATVTVPLVLQALGGVAGDLYGWWLLFEQIAIMLLGMALKKKLMIRWGLYVALAAVLYQLRNLGWAALAVLAVFLIGLAIFRLQRTDHSGPTGTPPTN